MKVLRYLLYFLLLLIVIFLLAGVVKPMVSYESSATVNQPMEQAWNLYNDMDKIQEWIPEVKNIETLKETKSKIGSLYNITVDNNGKEVVMQEDVIAFKRFEELGLKFRTDDMIKTDITKFQSVGNRTKITTKHEVVGASYLSKCMFAFFGPMFKKIDQSYMNNFKSWAEAIGPVEQKLDDKKVEDVALKDKDASNSSAEVKKVVEEAKPKVKKKPTQVANALAYPSDCPHDQVK